MKNNSNLIDKTVEITIARVSNQSLENTSLSDSSVSSFMQSVYDKLVELNKKSDND